jgi:mxaA protein
MRQSWVWWIACAATAAAAQDMPSAEVRDPRAFGWHVGDVVQRRIALQVPDGYALDMASLPQARRPGQALELRAARLTGSELVLDYQVFLSPPEVRTIEMPPLQLRFAGAAGERFVRVEAWPVTVAPLAPVEVSPRHGLGEMRPDVEPPPIPTAARRVRLAVYAALLAAIALYLLQVYVGLPWSARRRRPFAQAWRTIDRLPAAADAGDAQQRRAAFLKMHEALNASAGEVLFEHGLARFLAAQPRFAPLREALADFFARSRNEFFAAEPPRHADADLQWLRRLCRDCRDAERGSA